MKLLLLFALVFVPNSSASVHEEFLRFKDTFGKSYSDGSEHQKRKDIFGANLKTITAHNEKFANGEATFAMKINQYSDRLHGEIFTGRVHLNRTKFNQHVYDPSEELPKKVNWRKKGVVTPVKDQRDCGACWAFSATGTLEGMWAIKTGNLTSLSEQNILECAIDAGWGCFGGFEHLALDFVKEQGGINSENEYPYVSGDGFIHGWCKYQQPAVKVQVQKVIDIPEGDEKALQSAVAKVGPISVALHVNEEFMHYSHGIFDGNIYDCDQEYLNHALLIVGYGTDAKTGKDYWIVKNSFGTSWGRHGYGRIARNKNLCGIANKAVYPVV